jgi:hypothetical protein
MLDPKEIINACNEAHTYGQNAQGSLAQPFLNAAPDMSIASTQNAMDTINAVQGVGQKMLAQMSNLRDSIDKQLAAHQDAQTRQKSYDFSSDMSDLRPTTAVGFPREMPGNFFAPFRTGMK